MTQATQTTSTGSDALRLKLDETRRSGARIKVVGVGGGTAELDVDGLAGKSFYWTR